MHNRHFSFEEIEKIFNEEIENLHVHLDQALIDQDHIDMMQFSYKRIAINNILQIFKSKMNKGD